MNSKIAIFLTSILVIVSSCSNGDISKNADSSIEKDSCLYKAIIKGAEQSHMKVSGLSVEDEYDTSEVLSSLRRLYYDTVMQAFSQTTRISISGDSIGKLILSEYLFDTSYYRVIKDKAGEPWKSQKIEGYFMFKNDRGVVHHTGIFILKGPPNILIARSSGTSFTGHQRKFLLDLIPLINDCRGT